MNGSTIVPSELEAHSRKVPLNAAGASARNKCESWSSRSTRPDFHDLIGLAVDNAILLGEGNIDFLVSIR
jgi:hypothetical protein